MNFIVAVTNDYAIGKNNNLLFHLPTDLKYFKEKTLNKIVIMGERTYLSLPVKPLPKRTTIVLSNNPNFNDDRVIIARSLEDLFNKLKQYNDDDIFVCGGASVYNLLMDYCKTGYITRVNITVPADTYIDNIDKKDNFELTSQTQPQTENGLEFKFQEYTNKNVKPR